MDYNIAAYVWNMGGPGKIEENILPLQVSGLTTVILFGIHIGREMDEYPKMKVGDLMYNDFDPNLLVSCGEFNPNKCPAIAAWPAQVAQLKQQGSVSKVFLTLGGDDRSVYDFRTIQNMFKTADGKKTLEDNIVALKNAFTVNGVCGIDGFDFDNEEDGIDVQTFILLGQLLFRLGFEVTFCPYKDINDWTARMQALWDLGMKVSWWNLQCYAGGRDNRRDLSPWISALEEVVGQGNGPSYLVPGLAVKGVSDVKDNERQCPDEMGSTFKGWKNPQLAGGFLWKYDALVENYQLCGGFNTAQRYVKEINEALTNSA